MALTLRQIIAKTTRDRAILAREVTITKIKTGYDKGRGTPLVACSSWSPHDPKTGMRISNPPKYITTVVGLEGAHKKVGAQYVEVSCQCPDFWAVWEYALNKKGAAQIKFSNGEKPVEKNPSMIPGCCKHVIALGNHIISHGM